MRWPWAPALVALTPGGTAGSFALTRLSPGPGLCPATAAFPVLKPGRLPHHLFRGLLSVHSRYGLPTRGVAYATLSTRGFDGVVTSTTAPIATGWSESCRVGILPRRTRAFPRRTSTGC